MILDSSASDTLPKPEMSSIKFQPMAWTVAGVVLILSPEDYAKKL